MAQGRFRTSSAPQNSSAPGGTASEGKKVGLMQRLLNKAKPHKSEHKHLANQSEPQAQQQSSAPLDKSSLRHVHMAEDSKENLPATGFGSQSAQQQQNGASMSSSLPLTPAFEGQIPHKIRRSSIPASEDHHQQAFENSSPGRIALAIAPQVSEMKGMPPS